MAHGPHPPGLMGKAVIMVITQITNNITDKAAKPTSKQTSKAAVAANYINEKHKTKTTSKRKSLQEGNKTEIVK